MSITKVLSSVMAAIIITSCAANRVKSPSAASYLSKTKTGHFKNQEIVCITPVSKYPETRYKALLQKQSDIRQSSKYAFSTPLKNKATALRNRRNNNVDPEKRNPITLLQNRPAEQFQTNFIMTEPGSLQPVPLKENLHPAMGEGYRLHSPHQTMIENIDVSDGNTGRSEDLLLPASGPSVNPPFCLTALKKKEPLQPAANNDEPQNDPVRKRGRGFYLMTFLTGCLILLGLKKTPEYAKQVSQWATMNPWKTRLMIAGIHIVAGVSGIILGEKLADGGTHFTDLSTNIVAGTFLTSALLYPVRKSPSKLFKHTWFRQKTHDLALFITGCMLMVNLGNQYPGTQPPQSSMAGSGKNWQRSEYVTANFAQPVNHLMFYQDEKQIQDEKTVPQKEGMNSGAKVLLAIMAVAAAAGLGYGLLLLSCSIACSGMEGLAWLVGIAGGILIIALLAWTLKIIFNPKPKRVPKTSII